MCSWSDPGDPVAIGEINGELRHAHLELQSAQRAADRLRVRFTIEDIARHAQQDILRHAHDAALALHTYFSSVQKHIPNPGAIRGQMRCALTEEQVLQAVARVCGYMRAQREKYLPIGQPLDKENMETVRPFFSPTLLAGVKVVQMVGRRFTEPSSCPEARTLGYEGLLEFTHMASVTFEDVLVFNEQMTDRLLFHALVHAVQFRVLGLQRYTELFVRAFLGTRWRFSVPLEGHAFELESKFAADPRKFFSVEDEVRMRATRDRY